ncbi:Sortilin-related receptor [Thelohanellus kitauei]|uniref:Sortilin-related receptor n=1 Tax=Thelohanellus kitauei TaxID=669202 RepID=A0A0C2MCD6_THEKT|nr:Sortilin-related receptor [Thelohanellus kitauei]
MREILEFINSDFIEINRIFFNKTVPLIPGYSVPCPPNKKLVCENKKSCYNNDEICDGFNDCSDGTDEKDCPEPHKCIENSYFKCKDGKESICISVVCNGVEDCDDGSDENQICSKIPFKKILKIIPKQ